MPTAVLDRTTPKAALTRAKILGAAERRFAAYGFHGTRLEDIAEAVGIRRASIVYHFPDKPALYDAVLADALGGLYEGLAPALLGAGPLRDRVRAAVSHWVHYVGGRPTLARLLLREAVEGEPGVPPALVAHTGPFLALAQQVSAETTAPYRSDAHQVAHLASTIAGTTLFFVGAMARLVPTLGFDPLASEPLEHHRQEMLQLIDRLLGHEETSS